LSESLSKKPSTPNQSLMPTGQNKLIRRLIKHTVEFSRIRRTHVATQRVPVAWGNWSNLASDILPWQILGCFALTHWCHRDR